MSAKKVLRLIWLDKLCGIHVHLKYFDVLVHDFCQHLHCKWFSKIISFSNLKNSEPVLSKDWEMCGCATDRKTDGGKYHT